MSRIVCAASRPPRHRGIWPMNWMKQTVSLVVDTVVRNYPLVARYYRH